MIGAKNKLQNIFHRPLMSIGRKLKRRRSPKENPTSVQSLIFLCKKKKVCKSKTYTLLQQLPAALSGE
jgi:hypothetical protein